MNKFITDFKTESRRQESFRNSFWRLLSVILVSIVIIQWAGPYILFYGTNVPR